MYDAMRREFGNSSKNYGSQVDSEHHGYADDEENDYSYFRPGDNFIDKIR